MVALDNANCAVARLGAEKDAGQGVVIFLRDRIELVIVAAGAGDGQRLKGLEGHVDLLVGEVHLELPAVGTKLTQGHSFGTIESVKAVSELYAPVSGEVVETNDALKSKPEQVNSDPHGSWLIAVKLSTPSEAGGLLDATQYAELVK